MVLQPINSRDFSYGINSYGCNACNGHRDKQQEHSHIQNVTFVTTLKETNPVSLAVLHGFDLGSVWGQDRTENNEY